MLYQNIVSLWLIIFFLQNGMSLFIFTSSKLKIFDGFAGVAEPAYRQAGW